MSETQNQNAPAQGPLTPVYLVWPGESFSQTWTFLWIGFAFLMAGLLPWGPGAKIEGTENFAAYNPNEPMGLARALITLAAIGLIIHCCASIWARRWTSGANTANLFCGLVVLAEVVLAKFWEQIGPLLAEVGAIFGTPSEKAKFEAIFLERGPGYYLALFGSLFWILMLVVGIAKGSAKLKEKEEAKKAAQAAAAAERAAARKPGAGTGSGDAKS